MSGDLAFGAVADQYQQWVDFSGAFVEIGGNVLQMGESGDNDADLVFAEGVKN
ncbi:hypothetical protein GSbR_27070 [Geobacter sp. SVR]|nr:hypothetical protein GSVR_32180 [Geobacter sp. SVR]GCF86107.1 hypothetical protein GSbR_27070 [Geobacter sp. SVR]